MHFTTVAFVTLLTTALAFDKRTSAPLPSYGNITFTNSSTPTATPNSTTPTLSATTTGSQTNSVIIYTSSIPGGGVETFTSVVTAGQAGQTSPPGTSGTGSTPGTQNGAGRMEAGVGIMVLVGGLMGLL